jgi:phage virion morphogenesis protein
VPKIEIEFSDKQITQLFQSAKKALGGDLSPIMKDIGEHLLNETQERFDRQVDPDEKPWKPLLKTTRMQKKNPRILQEQGRRGGLLSSIDYRAGKKQVTLGTNKPYAAIHQFGGKTSAHVIRPKKAKALRWIGGGGNVFFAKEIHHPGSVIPARPFLGVSKSDETEILEIINLWLTKTGL